MAVEEQAVPDAPAPIPLGPARHLALVRRGPVHSAGVEPAPVTVRVQIGRVEVIGPPPRPKPDRAAPRPRAESRLDAYLREDR